METTDDIRKKIKRLINERGLNYAQVSLSIGKNIAYLQQYIKNGSPRRLGEVERHKLAQILRVEEQELTDLALPNYGGTTSINTELLTMIFENTEQWLLENNRTYSPTQKADLVRFLYMKLGNDILEVAVEKVREYIAIYDELRKAD